MAAFEKINKAKEILCLPETATLKEIRESYKNLCLKYHPDRVSEDKKKEYGEIFIKITKSYNFLLSYCSNYPYSFKKEDVKKVLIEESDEEFKRFFEGWWEK